MIAAQCAGLHFRPAEGRGRAWQNGEQPPTLVHMSNGRIFTAWVNPLQFIDVDVLRKPTTLEMVMDFLCTPGMPSDLESVVGRYQEISTEPVRLVAAPAEDRILEKLVWPLRHAKASFMLGNYLGTVSLCGLVAEMVAILLWEMASVQINGQKMTEKDEKALFGWTFERLGQERRVAILLRYGIVDDRTKEAFEVIRTARNRYLHLWSKDYAGLSKDAVSAYQAAVSILGFFA